MITTNVLNWLIGLLDSVFGVLDTMIPNLPHSPQIWRSVIFFCSELVGGRDNWNELVNILAMFLALPLAFLIIHLILRLKE